MADIKYSFNMEDEVICDYLVTSKMKKVWALQLEMVSKFASVCEKYGLKWFASGGTLLGAVRHNGYIPWDDDVDIHMLSADFEKFCLVAPKELKPYDWQECRNVLGFSPWHAKIRNANTTGCTFWERKNWPASMNKGIFIDIFPLDYIPEDPEVYRRQQVRVKEIAHSLWLFHWNRFNCLNPSEAKPNESYQKEFEAVSARITYGELCKEYLAACQSQKSPTSHLGATSFDCLEPRFVWPTKNYREMVDLPFMGATIKAPIEWDACLKQQYADYMVIRKGTSMHSDIIFDTDVPYSIKLAKCP